MRQTGLSTASAILIFAMCGSAMAQTADFMKQEGPDMWRASKLAGVNIYGPDNKKVGDITDVLMDHNGKATAVVIGVGGFLGIDEKDVAIPFDQVKFTQEPMANTTAEPMPANGAPAAPNGAAAPGLGTPATANGGAAAPASPGMGTATAPAHNPSTAYPDHGTIALTADQLKSAPSFQFAK